jgi:PAS domain S-box-containing protein
MMASNPDSAFLQHLMDFNVVPIVTFNTDGRMLSVNDAFLELIGYSREDMEAGRVNWRALTPPEYLPVDEYFVEQLKQSTIIQPYVKEYIRKDGSRVAIQLFNGRAPDDASHGVAIILEI